MEIRWPRQKVLLSSPRGHVWSWTAPTKPATQNSFTGTSRISIKLPSCSWKAPQTTTKWSMMVSRPLWLRRTAPSTCTSPQCGYQTQLCTTVPWETLWEKALGSQSTNPGPAGGTCVWQPCVGRVTASLQSHDLNWGQLEEKGQIPALVPHNPRPWSNLKQARG